MPTSAGRAPNRSARTPLDSRPAMLVPPESPSIDAAAIFVTPRSMAWATMWKIGPECAAQHAKWTRATPQNAGWRSTAAAVISPPRAAPRGSEGAASTPYPRRPRSSGRLATYRSATAATTHVRTPNAAKVTRQPSPVMRARAVGGTTRIPRPMPLEMMPMARPRRAANQRVAVADSGT